MNESIIVSMNGDTITITTEPTRSGLLLDKEGLLSLLGLFIGERDVFYKREIAPTNAESLLIDWNHELARHLGVCIRGPVDSPECPECGRLVSEPGLCGHCADERSHFSKLSRMEDGTFRVD